MLHLCNVFLIIASLFTDVVAFVKAMGQLEEPRTQSAAKCWLRMILQDEQL